MELPFEGGCLCGGTRYRVGAAPRHAGYCHCRMCQRAAGAPAVAWLSVASEAFAWIRGEPAVYRSSERAERLFCPACGTQLASRQIAGSDHLEITLASLDDPAAVRPSEHIWSASRIAWFQIADDLPRHPQWGPSGAG